MARGRRSSYTRDNNGRFASSPGGGGPKRSTPATRRAATRAGNRLNRDNSGRITGIGRDGATVRGGRIRTAKGNRRATQIASMRPAGFRSGTIAKGGRGVRGSVARSLAAVRKERAGRVPAAQRPGSLTSTLRGTLRTLARTDAARIRELEAITGQRVKPTAAGARAGAEAGARVRGTVKGGKVAGTLRAGLRELAQSDARTAREMAAIVRDATPKVAGGKGGKAIRGGRAALPAGKPAAGKQQPQKPSKKPVNKAQRAYLDARSNARDRNRDLRGADAGSRRMANSAAAVLRNMERRRSAAVPKAPADSPRARQQQRQLARSQRAGRNERAAWAREADGPNSKASRSATVARRAQQIYAGKVDPKAKTKSRLTKTRDPEVLRKRIARIKDNTARAAAKAAAKEAKAAAKPAKKESKRNISDAKAGRIIARLDANRPGLRKATGSDRRNRNLLQTYDRASKFVLAASTRESKRSGGQSRMDLAESVRRAVRNAKAKTKPKPKPKPTAPKRTRSARPAGTVAKPRGMKPGALAARRGAKAGPAALTGKGKAPGSRLTKPVKQEDGSFDVNGRPAKTMQDAMRVLRQQRAQEKERALSAKRISASRRVDRADLQAVEKGKGKRANNPYARENAIFRFSQKETQASNRADKVANQGRALEAEYTKLTRKPATKANEKRIQQLRSQITKLRRSFDTLLKASKSYNQRGLAVRRPFPRIYR